MLMGVQAPLPERLPRSPFLGAFGKAVLPREVLSLLNNWIL
jgi:hypothetical protein